MPEKENNKKYETVNFVDLDEKLPLGILDKGAYNRTVKIKRWTLKQEKELGEIREKNPQARIGQYVSMVIAHMCTQLGPWDFEKLSEVDKLLNISQMFAGDVFYVYCLLRYKSLGKELVLNLQCPRCSNSFPYDFDMGVLKVNSGKTVEDFYWEHKLFEPYEIRGKLCEGFVFRPIKWNTYESINNDEYGGIGEIKSKMILGSLCKLIGQDETILIDQEIEELGKRDIETITNRIENDNLGPDMSVSVKCKCRYEFITALKWNYDDFFAVSSR
jgi:hypothetical protein